MYYGELKKTQKTDDQTPRAKPDAPRRVAAVSPDVEGLGELDLKALNLKEDHRDDPLVVELRRDIRRSFMVLDESPPKNVAPVSPAPSYLSMIFCASDIDWDFCSSYPRARRVRRRETIRAARRPSLRRSTAVPEDDAPESVDDYPSYPYDVDDDTGNIM